MIKAVGEGLKGFVDLTDPNVSESAEMSCLIARFATRMRKRATNTQGEATHGSDGSDGKHSRWSSSEEEAKKSPMVISVDSPERAPDGLQST